MTKRSEDSVNGKNVNTVASEFHGRTCVAGMASMNWFGAAYWFYHGNVTVMALHSENEMFQTTVSEDYSVV